MPCPWHGIINYMFCVMLILFSGGWKLCHFFSILHGLTIFPKKISKDAYGIVILSCCIFVFVCFLLLFWLPCKIKNDKSKMWENARVISSIEEYMTKRQDHAHGARRQRIAVVPALYSFSNTLPRILWELVLRHYHAFFYYWIASLISKLKPSAQGIKYNPQYAILHQHNAYNMTWRMTWENANRKTAHPGNRPLGSADLHVEKNFTLLFLSTCTSLCVGEARKR